MVGVMVGVMVVLKVTKTVFVMDELREYSPVSMLAVK